MGSTGEYGSTQEKRFAGLVRYRRPPAQGGKQSGYEWLATTLAISVCLILPRCTGKAMSWRSRRLVIPLAVRKLAIAGSRAIFR